MSRYHSVGEFPIVIEPTVQVLEAKAGCDDVSPSHPSELSWTRLVRVPLATVSQALTLPSGVVHVFGVDESLEACVLLLCYENSGVLRHVAVKQQGEWQLQPASPEMIGEPDMRPSVRLVFQDERTQRAFMFYLEQVQGGRVHNPTLAVVLDKLACPPIAIGVGVNGSGS